MALFDTDGFVSASTGTPPWLTGYCEEMHAAYDLLIKADHVLDPVMGLDGAFDIGIRDGRITSIGHDLAAPNARRTLEVRGAQRYVVPGLIDLHTHVAFGATTPGVGLDCCEPDVVGVQSGVTTVVDTGSVGVTNIGVFRTHLQPKSARELFAPNWGPHPSGWAPELT